MRRFVSVASVSLSFLTAGCEGHQAKVDKLQKEYDQAANQFQKDCAAEYLKVPPTLSPKCQDEKQKQADAWKRLEDERAKK